MGPITGSLDFVHPQYHPPEYHNMPYPTLLYPTISPLFWRPPLILELTCNTMSGDLTPESVELLHVISEPLKVELAYAPWEANTQRHPWKILTTLGTCNSSRQTRTKMSYLNEGWVSSWENPPKNEFAVWPDHNSSPGPVISRLFRLLSGPWKGRVLEGKDPTQTWQVRWK